MDAPTDMLAAINAEPLRHALPEVKAEELVENSADWPKEVKP